MRKIPARHGRSREHGKALCQLKASIFRSLQQFEQGRFLGMIRAGGIAGSRADAFVTFADQLVVIQRFIRIIAPQLLSDPLMHAFSEGFSQSVGQGLHHDGVVIIVGVLELHRKFLSANAGCDCKATDIIATSGLFRQHEIRQRHHRFAWRLVILLAQVVEHHQFFLTTFIGIKHQVVATTIGRPETDHTAGLNALFVDHKERCPVDEVHQFVQIIGLEPAQSQEGGTGRGIVVIIDGRCALAGFTE